MAKRRTYESDETVFAQYVRHADILRNWFVGYGIGGLVLFFSKDTFLTRIPRDQILCIAEFFLLGVGAQVLLAFINKLYNFHL